MAGVVIKDYWLLPILAGIALIILFFSIYPYLFYDTMNQWITGFPVQIMSFVCHQNLERTIFLNGIPASVCARCLGIYAGFASGFLSWLKPVTKWGKYSGSILAVAFFAMVLDVIGQWIGFWAGSSPQRLISGVFFGVSLSVYFVMFLHTKK